jgi:hypothetical protein
VRATFFFNTPLKTVNNKGLCCDAWYLCLEATHLVRHTYVHCLDNPVNETIQYTEYATSMSTIMTHGSKVYGT